MFDCKMKEKTLWCHAFHFTTFKHLILRNIFGQEIAMFSMLKLWDHGQTKVTRSNINSVIAPSCIGVWSQKSLIVRPQWEDKICATDGLKDFTALSKSSHLQYTAVTLTTISTDSPPNLFWTIMVYLPESSMETPLIVRLANLPWSMETTYWNGESKVKKVREAAQGF